jgi:Bacteroidetes VLRF1 release factor/Ankyrin repeat
VDIIRKKQLPPNHISKSQPDRDNGAPPPAIYKGPHIFLCMIGGGHFAAMVVSLAPKQMRSSATGPLAREATVLAHKTFHRYTTRRKQGGAQSANDSAKGAAHSAGSSLRRYNEVALTDEVRLLLSDWKGMIDSSELLFVRATGNTNRRTLFGPYEGQILRQNDSRLRGFPFSTRRATQHELMRSFLELTRVKVQEIEKVNTTAAAAVTETQRPESFGKPSKQSYSTISKRSEEEETAILHTAQIQALIRRSKLPTLLSYLKSNNLSSDFIFYPQDAQQNYHASTPLHLAASLNSPTLVSGLLIKAGANPAALNGDGKPAFDLTGDRATRDAFRVARSSLGENRWNWDTAHVPSALSKSEADERDERERQEIARREEERRKAEAERLKLEGPKVEDLGPLGKAAGRGRALALGHVQKTARERREEESRGLTPEMRTKLEREQRARAAEERIRKLQSGA